MKTVRDLAKENPEMYDYYYKWRGTEQPELEKSIEEILYHYGYEFVSQDDKDMAGEYNDLKGYLNCEIKELR